MKQEIKVSAIKGVSLLLHIQYAGASNTEEEKTVVPEDKVTSRLDSKYGLHSKAYASMPTSRNPRCKTKKVSLSFLFLMTSNYCLKLICYFIISVVILNALQNVKTGHADAAISITPVIKELRVVIVGEFGPGNTLEGYKILWLNRIKPVAMESNFPW